MVTTDAILSVLAEIPDPEMPISIVDLGLIEGIRIDTRGDATHVSIDVLPTFVGCPALDMIRSDIVTKVGALAGVDAVEVRFIHDPPWSVTRITEPGRASLRAHGVTVPEHGSSLAVAGHGSSTTTVPLTTSAIPCPFCESTSTRLESKFGPTRCRMIYYCDSCRNTFEHMKRL